MGITATTLVLVWTLHFRDGLSLNSENKQKIFNVKMIDVFFFFHFPDLKVIFFKLIFPLSSTYFSLSLQVHPVLMVIGFIFVAGEGN